MSLTTSPVPQTLYLDGTADTVCVALHVPPNGSGRDTGVLLCPPFGWDEVCSYRSRRNWANELALAGYPTLRISLPSTGDSGGTARDAGRLDAWTTAIASAARWLPTAASVQRITAIGIGLGGVLAFRAAAAGAPIEDLVLWSTPARGRALVRELRAFARLEQSEFFGRDDPEPPQLPKGDLTAGGFLIAAQTLRDLEALDLTGLALPAPTWRRALLLERDGISVDKRLRQHLETAGVAVTVAPGKGYSAMMNQPQQSRTPFEAIVRVRSWLDDRSQPLPSSSYGSAPPVGSRPRARIISTEGVQISERPLSFPQPFGELSAIIAEPPVRGEHGLCALLLNAGAIRRIGPSRMWVEASRRWAALGVPTVRLDVEGIGDSDGEATSYVVDAGLYVPRLTDQVLAVVEQLHEQQLGERFVLGGLCSGAYWAFHAALVDPRVVAALMVNPRALIWDPLIGPARDFKRAALRPSEWRKLRTASPARFRAVARWGAGAPRRLGSSVVARASHRPPRTDELGAAFDRLLASGKRGLLAFSGDEPLHREMTRSGHMARLERWPNISLEFLPGRDHTLRPSFAQQRAHEALDRALARELELSSAQPPDAQPSRSPQSGDPSRRGHPARRR